MGTRVSETVTENVLRGYYTSADEQLRTVLKQLNSRFHNENKVRDTDRSMFFSGLMIALTDATFRETYKQIQPPTVEEVQADKTGVLIEAGNLNSAIVDAIDKQLKGRIDTRSKKVNWRDRFSFIKTIAFPLDEYKQIIETIETNIFVPYQNEENQDILGKAYRVFLERAGKIDNKNIILTPDHIKDFMVKLARLGPDDVVLDTCTGTGGFLMEAMEVLCRLAEGDTQKLKHVKERQLIGFENDVVLFSLACSNMFLHGDGRSTLLYRSSLLDLSKREDEALFDYVRGLKPTRCIINPPYENSLSIQFTRQAIDYLEPGGKLVIIMPEPTLKHHPDAVLEILKTAKLDYVITMPDNLFAEQNRTVNTAIFGFTKTPHNVDDEVLFYDLSDDGYVTAQKRGRIDRDGRWNKIEEQALHAVRNLDATPGVSRKLPVFHDGVFYPKGWEETSDDEQTVRVCDLFNIEKGTLASNHADNQPEGYTFITASREWKTHSTYEHDTEALIIAVSASGSLGRTHYVKGKFTASNLCLTLTPKEDSLYPVNLEFYYYYFQTIRDTLVQRLVTGTSKKTIDRKTFAEYPIRVVPIEEQQRLVETLRQKTDHCENLRLQLTAAEQDLKTNLERIQSDDDTPTGSVLDFPTRQ